MALSSPSAPPSVTSTSSTTRSTTSTRSSRSSSSAAPRSRLRAATVTSESAMDPATQHLVAQLEQISLELAVSVRREDDVRYVLAVRHARARALWKHPRSFDEYHRFQERMLHALHHGHVCRGECPWLETFVVSYFPAKSHFLLGSTSRMLLERRRDALALVLQTIRSFLLKRENLACSVARTHVAHEFLGFVYGELLDEQHVLGTALQLPAAAVLDSNTSSFEHARSSIEGFSHRGGVGSSNSSSSDDGESNPAPAPVPAPALPPVGLDKCPLCDLPMPAKNIYVMQLRCGHRFHDECVLPKLNEALRCPTCGARDV